MQIILCHFKSNVNHLLKLIYKVVFTVCLSGHTRRTLKYSLEGEEPPSSCPLQTEVTVNFIRLYCF